MNGVNKFICIGWLGQDPELRHTANGTAVANLSVATHYKDTTAWHRAVCWSKAAEFAAEYLKKGDQVYIEGRLDYRKWSQGDQDRVSAEISVHTLQAVGAKDRGSRGAQGAQGAPVDYPKEQDGNTRHQQEFLDDIPF